MITISETGLPQSRNHYPCRFNRLRRSYSRRGRAPCRLALSLAETDVRRHVLSTLVVVPTFEEGPVRRQVCNEVTDATRNGRAGGFAGVLGDLGREEIVRRKMNTPVLST